MSQPIPAADPSVIPPLTLPGQRVSAWVVETRPADTRTWLGTLTLSDANDSAQQLYQALFTLNRMSLDANDRLQIMELYREPVAVTAHNLQSHFTHFAMPLRPRLKQLADFLCQLHLEMAYGYKHVLTAAREEPQPWGNPAVLLTAARAITYLGETLLRCYQAYMPVIPGVWSEIHSLFRYSENHGQHETSLAEMNHGEELSVTRAYLQAVMLGLCGPYQLPQNECRQVNAFLGRWAHKAGIGTELNNVDPVGHFLIDLTADHPAMPYPRDVPIPASPDLRAVNAIELARTVHGFMTRLQKGEPAPALQLGFDCVGIACVDSLRRMLRFWGLAGHRHFSRRSRKQPLSLCVGLSAIHFFASGQTPFTQPHAVLSVSEQGTPPPTRADLEAEASDTREAPPSSPEMFRIDTRWQLRDESAGGLSLVRHGDLGPHLRVGDILGIHNPQLEQWRIGVVRWLKSPDSQQLEMGVEMLAPSAHPVAMRPAAGAGVPYAPALLLPGIEVLRQPATLLVTRGSCQRGEDIDILDATLPPRRVRVLSIVERTGAFSQVVFADVARG